jgi:hypothetical protein
MAWRCICTRWTTTPAESSVRDCRFLADPASWRRDVGHCWLSSRAAPLSAATLATGRRGESGRRAGEERNRLPTQCESCSPRIAAVCREPSVRRVRSEEQAILHRSSHRMTSLGQQRQPGRHRPESCRVSTRHGGAGRGLLSGFFLGCEVARVNIDWADCVAKGEDDHATCVDHVTGSDDRVGTRRLRRGPLSNGAKSAKRVSGSPTSGPRPIYLGERRYSYHLSPVQPVSLGPQPRILNLKLCLTP